MSDEHDARPTPAAESGADSAQAPPGDAHVVAVSQAVGRSFVSPLAGPSAPRMLAGNFRAIECLLGVPLALVVGGMVGYLAALAQVELHFAPLAIFQLLMGVGLGAALFFAMRLLQFGHRPTLLAITILAAAAALVAQYYVTFRLIRAHSANADIVRQVFAEEAALRLPAETFVGFLRQQIEVGRPIANFVTLRGPWVCVSWLAEAALLLAAALAMIALATRQPYCKRCQSWYRTMRSGRIDAATAQRVGVAVGGSVNEHARAVRYRLRSCRSGCGASRLELFWEEPDGSTGELEAWLDSAARNRVMQIVDQPSEGPAATS